MSKYPIYKILVGVVMVTIFTYISFGQIFTVKAETSCINLSYDLSSGSTDSISNGPILMFQNYLRSLGYLVATPNGHFGPATFSAVKTFQTMNNISSTGLVGPLTRAALSRKTCASSASTVSSPIVLSGQPIVTVVRAAPLVSNTNVTSPATGQVLSIGSSTVIRWSMSLSGNYDITLEQPSGIGAGFIASSQSTNLSGNQYVWKVGKIYSSQSGSNQNVAAGTYRIRLQSSVSGASSTDQTSGWFTLVVPQLTVSSVIIPSSAFADDATSVVLYGYGFTTSTSIYFDTNYSNLRATNRYVSPDGTVLVFTIPSTVPAGPHSLLINDGINASPLTIPLNVSSSQ